MDPAKKAELLEKIYLDDKLVRLSTESARFDATLEEISRGSITPTTVRSKNFLVMKL